MRAVPPVKVKVEVVAVVRVPVVYPVGSAEPAAAVWVGARTVTVALPT